MNEKEKEYLQQWIIKAQDDFITINRLTDGVVVATTSICFHCQQLVEKYLKMFLVYNKQEIVKTHEIEFLLFECSKIDKDFEDLDPKNLSDFGVAMRYPGDFYIPTIEEALEYKALAFQIKDFIEKKVDIHQFL